MGKFRKSMLLLNPLRQWEAKFRLVELLDMRTTALGCSYFFHTNDLNRMSTGTMTGSHVSVAGGHGRRRTQFPIFTVHVVCAWSGVVSQPNAKVLDSCGRPFQNLFHWNNFARHLLELSQLPKEIPKSRLGHNPLRSKDFHLVERRVLLLLRRELPPNHLVLLQLSFSFHPDDDDDKPIHSPNYTYICERKKQLSLSWRRLHICWREFCNSIV